MPSCTDNPEQSGVWVCPYCRPRSSPITCYSLRDVDPCTTTKGQVRTSCKEPCTLAGFHGRDPGLFWEHVLERHGWDGRRREEEPPRYLDKWTPSSPPTKQLHVQPGPSGPTRAKARAKRKKKKRRR